ncbi:class I SAM-dependent methyltransferase [Microbispora corallina]|uniref:Methyltransferase type 11 n=1 Tax=Microbispora corallina TaxID=83302 RepID=A0ABQ4FYG1_9ACTN|nr:class I SAM-dependent methyltransferase [Microbispora corallina]GIH39860.1 methyltransferase type 11 [Microbispora corallina]
MAAGGVSHPVFARVYTRLSEALERHGLAERRRALLGGLSGHVVDVGAGNGLNFAHYPPSVERVIAVEPEPRLRRTAREAARSAPVTIEVVDGLADRLPVPSGAADAVVFSLVLCSLPDVPAALREARRVLRPDGRLVFLEHVRAPLPGVARVQRLLDAGPWPVLAGGCHLSRDAVAEVQGAGFAVERLDRFAFGGIRSPFTFFVLGAARPEG